MRAPGWWVRLLQLDDEQLFEELRFISDERFEEAKSALPLERRLSIAGFDPGDEAEARHRKWAEYLEYVPTLVCVACGVATDTVRGPDGMAVEVAPSWCARVLAFEVLAEFGLEDALESVPGPSGGTASDVLRGLRAMIESDLRSQLGITLRQARYRWRRVLRQAYVRREVRLGLERPTLTDVVVEAREFGRSGCTVSGPFLSGAPPPAQVSEPLPSPREEHRMPNRTGRVFSAWHREGEPFYHDNVNCQNSGSGEAGRLDGTGSKQHCSDCHELNGPAPELPSTFGR